MGMGGLCLRVCWIHARAVPRESPTTGAGLSRYCGRCWVGDDVLTAELEAALRQADVLSLHAPLTSQTQNLINAERPRWMKPTARLVNMARGGLVQLEDLCAVLRSGQLAGAALDVLPLEPPGAELEALLDTPNLLISPHMGWSSRQARSRLVQTLAGHLQAYVSAEAASA